MPEFLERRFSANCRWYLTGISIFAYIFTKISVALFAGAIPIREVMGWDYMTPAVLLVLATGVYTVAGGLAAVVYTDLSQALVLIGGALLLIKQMAGRFPDELIAATLNHLGLKTGAGNPWKKNRVCSLRSKLNLPTYDPAAPPTTVTSAQAAQRLGLSGRTRWQKRRRNTGR